MLKLTTLEIARIVSAELIGSAEVIVTGSVETDSRKVTAGSLFVAKPGEETDGHLFIEDAISNGAVAALVERPMSADIPQLLVSDVVLAMGSLAKYVVAEVKSKGKLQVVGVTGSNGKTTTKNMLGNILSHFGPTVAPQESYNNEVGAPYSMLRISEDTAFLVVELGAGGPGSIRYLAQMCQPDIGIELKVGLAHAGEFGGIENTQSIKAELVEELGADAIALLNADDAYVMQMQSVTKAQVLTFGTQTDSNYFASQISGSIEGTGFLFHSPNREPKKVQLQILGEHHVFNAMAALATADQLHLDMDTAIKAIEAMPLAERWRMELHRRPDGLTVINDAYNASPDSMKAALQTLAELGRQTGKKTVAILGEMAELGEYSITEHDAIGRIVVRLNLGQLVVIGAGAKLIHMGATQEGSWDGESKYFEQIYEAEQYLREMLTGEEIVLVKSSKSANLRYLGDALLEENK